MDFFRDAATQRNFDFTVLAVDDDAPNLQDMGSILERHGAKVVLAADGREALSCIQHRTVDLLLSDIDMPDMDGYQLLKRIRAYEQDRSKNDKTIAQIPAIAISGHTGPQEHRRSFEAGFALHINKPVDLDQLFAAIEAVTKLP